MMTEEQLRAIETMIQDHRLGFDPAVLASELADFAEALIAEVRRLKVYEYKSDTRDAVLKDALDRSSALRQSLRNLLWLHRRVGTDASLTDEELVHAIADQIPVKIVTW